MNKLLTIVVAAGSGTRMGKDFPKQFLLLDGEPIVMRTIRNLHGAIARWKGVGKFVHEMLVLLPEEYLRKWEGWCTQYDFQIPHSALAGGKNRFESVKNGIIAAGGGDADYILVHDGVRPFVAEGMMERLLDGVVKYGAVIPAVPVLDSLRRIEAGDAEGEVVSEVVDRAKYRKVQTPQVFRGDWIREAYEADYREGFTDDASVVERVTGRKIVLVDGEPGNVKITTPEDLQFAEWRMKERNL